MPQTRMSAPDAASAAMTSAPRSPPPTITARRSVSPKSIGRSGQDGTEGAGREDEGDDKRRRGGRDAGQDCGGQGEGQQLRAPDQKRRSARSR